MNILPPTKKSLGQHWLTDDASLTAMCDAAAVNRQDIVLEIGPGIGSLTAKLVQRAGKVVAVEYDAELAVHLPQRVNADNLSVFHADILTFDLTVLPPNYKVVANIPYYLSSNLLRVLCESTNPPRQMALLVQKEVAERVAAPPGAMSLLSVSVQFYSDVSLGQVIAAKLFTPPPKVDSQILKLKYHGPRFKDVDTKLFFRLVKAGFSNRRKTLLNSLSGGLQLPKREVEQLLAGSFVSPALRPQALTLGDWFHIYEAYRQRFPASKDT